MAEDQLVQQLARRIESLEAAVAELGEQLVKARTGGFRSMRDTHRCPACGHSQLVHFRRVQEQRDDNQLDDLSLARAKGWFSAAARAPLEAYACRRCYLVEWHARNFDELELDGERVVAVESEPPAPSGGPFR